MTAYRPLLLSGTALLAAASLLLATPAAAEDPLGRLFFSPERRQAMDRQRQLNQPEKSDAEDSPTLTINGVVTRSSGKRTVWVNGVAQHDRETLDGVEVIPERHAPGRVRVRPDDAPETRAAVGDSINRGTGETTPLLGGGQIRVPRPPAAPR